MNKAEFHNYLDHPASISEADNEKLKVLVADYPYFQTAHVLYAKGLHNVNNIRYEEQLKLTAACAADRKELYRVVMQPKLSGAIAKFEAEIAQPEVVEPIAIDTVVQEEELEVDIEVEQVESSTEDIVPVETPVVETPVDAASEEQTTDAVANDEAAAKQKETLAALEENILVEAINASIKMEVSTYSLEAAFPEEEAGELVSSDEAGEVEIAAEEPAPAPIVEAVRPANMSYLAWLRWRQKHTESASDSSDNSAVQEAESDAVVEDTSSLIDKFITEEPRITPQKTEFFSPVNMAKLSVIDNESFVSETLAKIYAEQGNYDKAISAYQHLQLKYPEKSTYFANLIKELNKKKK
jgi:tetratricopeptide (TPR) repeat protein